MITAAELKKKYLDFFKEKGHAVIPNASLIPENDPTVLFTPAGMHPLIPFLMGQKHPLGKRLVNVQKCLRTDDIDEVGDGCHHSFFEMLGNWSLGDYFKEDSIAWSFEFLTSKKWLGIDKDRIYITVFEGDSDSPKDEESAKVWESVGIPMERIFFLPKKDNWWIAGSSGPCGPDTEIFYDTGKNACGKKCMPGCHCGKYVEIWNNVFMQYNKTPDGKYEKLCQRNVDTGMGVERVVAVLNGNDSDYETGMFSPMMDAVRNSSKSFDERSARIVSDHARASVFLLAEGIAPKNVDRGYILRRLIRRAVRHGRVLGLPEDFMKSLAETVIVTYKKDYPHLEEMKKFIIDEICKEEKKFTSTLEKGMKKFEHVAKGERIDGKEAFLLFQSYGFPIEMTVELAKENGKTVDLGGYEKEFEKHQQTSRVGAEKKFKGGLSDASEQTTKLHTATHLLAQALRVVLKDEGIMQKGANITPERLRFDFNFDRRLTEEELKKVEDLVNEQIVKGLAVRKDEMEADKAKKIAQGAFGHKYGDRVYVYSIGDFSKEICGGPHMENTKHLGKFKILKEEAVAAGVRRIKAIVE